MKMNDALILRDRFFRGETTIDEERRLVSCLLADDCPEELAADRHAILMLAKEEVIAEMSKEPGSLRSDQSPKTHSLLTAKRYHRIAAVFLAAAFVGGLSFAAYHAFSPTKEQPAEEAALNPQPSTLNPSSEELIRFSNVRLDSILTTVCSYYGRELCFVDTTLREMRLFTTWNRNESLAEYINVLNVFDGLHLTDERDTVFVDSVDEKGE